MRPPAGLSAECPFAIVHQLNITGYREPGDLWRLPTPFVWGPVDGAANLAWSYFPLLSLDDKAFYAFRNLGNALQKRLLWRSRKAARRARHIWAIGDKNTEMVRYHWGRDAESVIENGAKAVTRSARSYDGLRPLRIVWNGTHIGRKALPILLHAMSGIEDNHRCELTVLGEGPATAEWKRLAKRLGLEARVRWTGQLSHRDVLTELGAADVLAHTSLLEATSAAVLEALTNGVPVICHDACGMGVAITSDCGIKVPLRNPADSIAGFHHAIWRLCADIGLVERLSAGAITRARELSWDSMADRIAQRYIAVAEGTRISVLEKERSRSITGEL